MQQQKKILTEGFDVPTSHRKGKKSSHPLVDQTIYMETWSARSPKL